MTTQTDNFKGSIALVTGAGQGIGRAIALRLAEDGFDVAVNDIISNQPNLETLVKEIMAHGRRAIHIIADVSQEEQVKAMIQTVVKELGSLDVVSLQPSDSANNAEFPGTDGRQCRDLPIIRAHTRK